MSAITVDGDIVHYEVLGRGKAVVLVHGWIGSWRYWIPTMQQLHLKFRVYAVDLFGYGDSAKNPEKYTIEHQVNLLTEFMSQLGLKKAAMIGHGLGALVMIEFAQRYQDKVARMLITSAPLFDPGNLESRVPPGQKILLTNSDFNASRAIHNAEVMREQLQAKQNQQNAAKKDDADKGDQALSSHQQETILNDRLINRARLREAALARAEAEIAQRNQAVLDDSQRIAAQGNPKDNPLYRSVGAYDSTALLNKAFKKSETNFEKLSQDITKMDDEVVSSTSVSFDPGRILDILRALPCPIVVVHGEDDPIIEQPDDDIWQYLTEDKADNQFLPVPLPGVRHFPMLENEEYFRVVGGFLEQQDISKIQIKSRWRRRAR